MLEDFFVVPAAAQRHRDGALGFCHKVQIAYIDASRRISAKTPATVKMMPDDPNQIR